MRDFAKGGKVDPRVTNVARCLIKKEIECQKEKCCVERNACRLDAHLDCYTINTFIEPFIPGGPGFPEGGPELGWEELLPDWMEHHGLK